MWVDTPEIAAPQCDSVVVEEFEDLDRHLAAIVESITQTRGGKFAPLDLLRELTYNLDHLGDGTAQKEMIMNYFIDAPQTRSQLEQAADAGLGSTQKISDIAHAWRAEALLPSKQGPDL